MMIGVKIPKVMKKVILLFIATIILASCSMIPENPRLSFGKKCSMTEDKQIAYSWIWVYNKEQGLDANKETCKELENK